MDNECLEQRGDDLELAISLTTQALHICDRLGIVYAAIDLFAAAEKLKSLQSPEP